MIQIKYCHRFHLCLMRHKVHFILRSEGITVVRREKQVHLGGKGTRSVGLFLLAELDEDQQIGQDGGEQLELVELGEDVSLRPGGSPS